MGKRKKIPPKKEQQLSAKQKLKVKSRAYISDTNSSLSSDNEMLQT